MSGHGGVLCKNGAESIGTVAGIRDLLSKSFPGMEWKEIPAGREAELFGYYRQDNGHLAFGLFNTDDGVVLNNLDFEFRGSVGQAAFDLFNGLRRKNGWNILTDDELEELSRAEQAKSRALAGTVK